MTDAFTRACELLWMAGKRIVALEDAATGAWKCGHPKTPENTKRVRNGTGIACRRCFNDHDKVYRRQRRARAEAESAG